MLTVLRSQKPNPVNAIQFSGGEPTIHPKIIGLIHYAKNIGFKSILIATNGVKITQDIEFAKKIKEADVEELIKIAGELVALKIKQGAKP